VLPLPPGNAQLLVRLQAAGTLCLGTSKNVGRLGLSRHLNAVYVLHSLLYPLTQHMSTDCVLWPRTLVVTLSCMILPEPLKCSALFLCIGQEAEAHGGGPLQDQMTTDWKRWDFRTKGL
jgi:hypothetical protein